MSFLNYLKKLIIKNFNDYIYNKKINQELNRYEFRIFREKNQAHKIFIAKITKPCIMTSIFGASSNGRTRDFGSLYHGSNPCAPTKLKTLENRALHRFFIIMVHFLPI